MEIEVIRAAQPQKPILRHLLELYLYEFSEMEDSDVDDFGLFDYNYLDNYWTEAGRHPFLLRVDGHWAGLALVREVSYLNAPPPVYCLAEFFVMRKYRRRGLGRQMAFRLWREFPGRWEVAQIPQNTEATAFWRRVNGEFTVGAYEELEVDNRWWKGPVQVFHVLG